MSAYKKIKTEYRTLASLVKAIQSIGYKPQVSKIPTDNSLPMYGYHGDIRPEKVSVRIDREQIDIASNDVGFEWDGKCYNAVISDWDQSSTFTPTVQGQLKQSYSVNEATRLAKMNGYEVQEERLPDGTINLVCSHYGY